MYGGGGLLIAVLLGAVGFVLRPGPQDSTLYTPGMTPSREDCVMARAKTYGKLDKSVLQTIATECELTVQSIEGHEKLRREWEDRKAARDAAAKPAGSEPATPAESDRTRRVWR